MCASASLFTRAQLYRRCIYLFVAGMQIPGSGTSASAPLFAAFVARLLDAKIAALHVRAAYRVRGARCVRLQQSAIRCVCVRRSGACLFRVAAQKTANHHGVCMYLHLPSKVVLEYRHYVHHSSFCTYVVFAPVFRRKSTVRAATTTQPTTAGTVAVLSLIHI